MVDLLPQDHGVFIREATMQIAICLLPAMLGRHPDTLYMPAYDDMRITLRAHCAIQC